MNLYKPVNEIHYQDGLLHVLKFVSIEKRRPPTCMAELFMIQNACLESSLIGGHIARII